MPFIPHTAEDTRAMLEVIGANSTEALFDEIPPEMRAGRLQRVPDGVGEMEMLAQLRARADQDAGVLCFAGAGCYDHHIPAAVWDLVSRGEFMTAYTPYQAEASQGTLQLIYEYQSMMAALMAMDVSNASVYDGGSALGEALLMAVRANRKDKTRRVLVPETLHPRYRLAAQAIVGNQGLQFELLPMAADGRIDPATAAAALADGAAALVIAQPNYFGQLEDVDALTDAAAAAGALSIAVVNPMAMSVLQPPGAWGSTGAGVDIACGDGQSLGIPMASGGPSFGFMCCRLAHVRQMPGRLIGRTEDTEGRTGFTLTLQAREQHIRRAKATSNICTNQGLLVTAATMHMALMGRVGLRRVAEASHANTRTLVQQLTALPGVELVFPGPVFHEAALRLPVPATELVAKLAGQRILPGVALGADYPALAGDPLLVCATEQRTAADCQRLVAAVEACL